MTAAREVVKNRYPIKLGVSNVYPVDSADQGRTVVDTGYPVSTADGDW